MTVHYFHSGQTGAPALTGELGSLPALLESCLVNGYNSSSVDSLSWSGGVVTAAVSTGHGFNLHETVVVSGADQAGYNGNHRVAEVVDANTFRFEVESNPGTATGTMFAKLAPAGWSRPHSGTNIAAFQNAGTGYLVQADHTTYPRAAAIHGFESMSAIDTGTNKFPTDGHANADGGSSWFVSTSASTAERPWHIIADDSAFHFIADGGSNQNPAAHFAGDIDSMKLGDDHHFAICGTSIDTSSSLSVYSVYEAHEVRAAGSYLQRKIAKPYFQTGGGTDINFEGSSLSNIFGNGIAFPSAVDNRMHLFPALVKENGDHLRGYMPGLYHCPQDLYGNVAHGSVETDVNIAGTLRTVIFLNAYTGTYVIDLTGPWRS